MKKYRTFLLSYFLIVPLLLSHAAIFIDFLITDRCAPAHGMMDALNRGNVDILYFADSVMRYHSKYDTNKEGIDELLSALSGRTVLPVNSDAYSALIYRDYVGLLRKTRTMPSLVVIPINMRSFSDGWVKYPKYNFRLQRMYINYLASHTFQPYDYITYKFFGEDDEIRAWEKQDVVYKGVRIGKIKELHLNETPAAAFRYYYMYSLDAGNNIFVSLQKTFDELATLQVPVLVYITPVNIEAGEKYAPALREIMTVNIAVVRRFLEKNRIRYLDLSFSLDPGRFVTPDTPSEHLNFRGRSFVAKEIHECMIREFHFRAHEPNERK